MSYLLNPSLVKDNYYNNISSNQIIPKCINEVNNINNKRISNNTPIALYDYNINNCILIKDKKTNICSFNCTNGIYPMNTKFSSNYSFERNNYSDNCYNK